MSFETVVLLAVIAVILLLTALVTYKMVPRKLKPEQFVAKWKELQGLCKDKSTWPQALIDADALLDKALRRRKFKGKSMGERMVSAQKAFTNNDAVWYAHNLRKKLTTDASAKLKEAEVKNALMGFRQALRDLGALPGDKEQSGDSK